MNSGQIEMALKKNRTTAPHFKGVFARDTLPQNPEKNSTSSTLIGMVNPEATGYVCKLGNRATVTSTAMGKRYPSSRKPISIVFLGTRKK